jgi:alanyl-tRNA synthetase
VVEQYGGAYPELQEKKDFIRKLITVEEQRFYETLDEGTEQIKKLMDEARSMKIIAGVDAFRMYDTYGFPVELLCEIVEEQGLAVDMDGFGAEMEKQRKRGREGRETSTFMGRKETVFDTLGTYGPTLFLGYDEKSVNDAKVLHVFKSDDTECVIADKTVIYAESGGQKGDGGVIETETGVFRVTDCTENSGKYVHFGVTEKGTITAGQTGCISYDAAKRAAAMRNHTATHILQKVLRQILGSHVEQAGSMVSGERLRFDFTHFEAVTAEQRHLIEEKVNDAVFDALDVNVSEMPVDEAKRLGAIALFGEKYGAYVRVVDIGGGYSVELCGGTHITNTAQIGSFKLVSESGISAGVRRIEGLTGRNVISYYKDMENRNEETVAELKRVIRKLTKDVEAANAGNAAKEAAGLADKMRTLNGVNILVSEIADADVAALREMGDELKSRFNPGVFVLAGTKEQKAAIIAMATDDAVKLGINCGAIIKAAAAAAGGSGGGKPNMAQAGVKDSSLIDDALKEADEMIKKALQQ